MKAFHHRNAFLFKYLQTAITILAYCLNRDATKNKVSQITGVILIHILL